MLHPDWLEYSPTTHGAYFLPCYLFRKPSEKSIAFVTGGFRNWRKVIGNDCAFKRHICRVNSSHDRAMKSLIDLRNLDQHIDKVICKYSKEEIAQNRLRLQASIDGVIWITNQGLALQARNEKEESLNRGNFIELVKFLGSYNVEVVAVTLKNAPNNATYLSPQIQKEILELLATRVRKEICQEIGNAKFCILVDESVDSSNKEQMVVVLRYVTEAGFIQERLLDLIHVPDTASKILKDAIFFLLNEHKLSVENIRGQGYDGASNMSGKCKGLKALVSNGCRFAYFVHCFAHQLQLALVAAAKEVRVVYGFFENKFPFIINFVGGSCKRVEELKQAQTNEIELLIAHDDVEIGREVIRDGLGTTSQRGDAESTYKTLFDFEFVFILHMMKEILEISNDLCQLLQRKSQDIVNAMDLLRSTQLQIQQLMDVGWVEFLEKVELFCEKEVDSNLAELNNRISETTNELMVLCVTLDTRDGYKMFNIENICRLVEKYYPDDFTDNEKEILKIQLRH